MIIHTSNLFDCKNKNDPKSILLYRAIYIVDLKITLPSNYTNQTNDYRTCGIITSPTPRKKMNKKYVSSYNQDIKDRIAPCMAMMDSKYGGISKSRSSLVSSIALLLMVPGTTTTVISNRGARESAIIQEQIQCVMKEMNASHRILSIGNGVLEIKPQTKGGKISVYNYYYRGLEASEMTTGRLRTGEEDDDDEVPELVDDNSTITSE